MLKSFFTRGLTLCAVVLLAACSDQKTVAVKTPPLPVHTVAVHASTESHWVEVLGRAEGGKEIEVRPQVGGILKSVRFREGDAVKAGDLMYEIDAAPYEARLRAAEAATRQAKAELDQAEREFRRQTQLWKANATSRKELDDAETGRNAARFALANAEANQKDARISLGYTRVTAPVDGIAGRTEVNPGALLSASTTLLTSITQRDDLRVRFAPSERLLGGAEITTKSGVRLFSANGKEYKARLDFVSQSLDPDTSTRLMRARFEEPVPVLPGEFVKVRLETVVNQNVFRVPQKAIVQMPDGSYRVYVRQGDKAVAKTVTVGLWEGTDWIVFSGVDEGDLVITDQLLRLRDGSSVTDPQA